MATSALEEKINKIRQQNEEIRRRHEEVEEDKKNAAKSNALVQMVPSTDWPERKEPPEFSNPSRLNNKPKSVKEHHDYFHQYHSVSGEGKTTFAQGQGPPPDPKYNFLADSEREEGSGESMKDNPSNRGQRQSRGMFKRKVGRKDLTQRDYRMNKGPYRDEHQPEYEAWRAERNRIDEDRISRQKTAEGNWRREWDNDKAHIVDEIAKSEAKLGNNVKKDHKDFDRRYHANGNDYAHHSRGSNHRSHRGNSRYFHNYENRPNNTYQDGTMTNHSKRLLSPGSEERTVTATDKSIKVILNQGNMAKGPVMSVKVNSPSIAGTGRVGPRQRSRITYSSHADVETTSAEIDSPTHPKSFEDKTKGVYHDNLQRSSNPRKSQPPKKRNVDNKSPYLRKKELRKENANKDSHKHETQQKSLYTQNKHRELDKSNHSNSFEETNMKLLQNNKAAIYINEKESDIIASGEVDTKNIELKSEDNQNNDIDSHVKFNEFYVKIESESILQNSNLDKVETRNKTYAIVTDPIQNESNETQIGQAAALSSEENKTDLIVTDCTKENKDKTTDNDRNETECTVSFSCNTDDKENIVEKSEIQSPITEETMEIINSCECKQHEDITEKDDIKRDVEDLSEEGKIINAIPFLTDVCFVTEQDNKVVEDDDKNLKAGETLIARNEKITAMDEKINSDDRQNSVTCTEEIQEHIEDTNDKRQSSAANDVMIDKIEFPEKDLQVGDKIVTNKD